MSRMARITFLCRGEIEHSRTGGFGSDQPLTATADHNLRQAVQQMRLPDRVLCAPEKSATETASILGKAFTVEPSVADIDYGAWTGRTLSDVAEADPSGLQSWIEDAVSSPHGGESIASFHARIRQWMEGNADQAGHLLVITHQPVIRSVILNVLDAPIAAFWRVDIEYGTITEITRDGRRWSLRAVNRPTR
ncbi:MAG: hypothetical protein DI589_25330 [Shinella sp.]|nr:MAG: hypothetical protein DI589_25330 [Shinella sp.]